MQVKLDNRTFFDERKLRSAINSAVSAWEEEAEVLDGMDSGIPNLLPPKIKFRCTERNGYGDMSVYGFIAPNGSVARLSFPGALARDEADCYHVTSREIAKAVFYVFDDRAHRFSDEGSIWQKIEKLLDSKRLYAIRSSEVTAPIDISIKSKEAIDKPLKKRIRHAKLKVYEWKRKLESAQERKKHWEQQLELLEELLNDRKKN